MTFEEDVIIRGIADDGVNLIIVGDTNSANDPSGGLEVGYFRCFVAFWNMKSQDMTRVWDFKDNSVYGVEVVEDEEALASTEEGAKASAEGETSDKEEDNA